MTEVATDSGPLQGSPACFLAEATLAAALGRLPDPPRDTGTLRLLLARGPAHVRSLPGAAMVTPDAGLVGDAWGRGRDGHPEEQIAVIRRDIAEVIANGQRLPLFGNNLFVDLDLSEDNLPPGSQLAIGNARFEVTPRPHLACGKFRVRFGAAAVRYVNAKSRRAERLRGVYWRVLQPGVIAVGDAISVVDRAGG